MKKYKLRAPMRAKDGTEYRPGPAVPISDRHVKEFGWEDRKAVGEATNDEAELTGAALDRQRRLEKMRTANADPTQPPPEEEEAGEGEAGDGEPDGDVPLTEAAEFTERGGEVAEEAGLTLADFDGITPSSEGGYDVADVEKVIAAKAEAAGEAE